MKKNKNVTIGQIIRRIRSNEISNVYSLFGGDPFLEDFFISEIVQVFKGISFKKIHFSLDQDSIDTLYMELSSISLFEDRKIIVVRELKKLRSVNDRKEIFSYLKNPNKNIILILINENFDLKNTFLTKIKDSTQFLDFRPPFENEMKKWIIYILKVRKINIDEALIDNYIQLYGDSIAHVINEVEKKFLQFGSVEKINKIKLDENNLDRTFHVWNLQDSLGSKRLDLALNILESLINNGNKITILIMSLFSMYQQLLWYKMGRRSSSSIGYTGINKIITNKIKQYNNLYTEIELKEVLQELRSLDVLSKSSSINMSILFQLMIVKICKGYYV